MGKLHCSSAPPDPNRNRGGVLLLREKERRGEKKKREGESKGREGEEK